MAAVSSLADDPDRRNVERSVELGVARADVVVPAPRGLAGARWQVGLAAVEYQDLELLDEPYRRTARLRIHSAGRADVACIAACAMGFGSNNIKHAATKAQPALTRIGNE